MTGEYYAHRFDELAGLDLLPLGSAVADSFRGKASLSRTEQDAALERGLGGSVNPAHRAEALDALRQLGYIWRVESRPDWEPGIPSLMDYVREFAPPPNTA